MVAYNKAIIRHNKEDEVIIKSLKIMAKLTTFLALSFTHKQNTLTW